MGLILLGVQSEFRNVAAPVLCNFLVEATAASPQHYVPESRSNHAGLVQLGACNRRKSYLERSICDSGKALQVYSVPALELFQRGVCSLSIYNCPGIGGIVF